LFHPIELLHAWATWRNDASMWAASAESALALWEHAEAPGVGVSIPVLDASPALLIVVMTYDRPNACSTLMTRLAQAIDQGRRRENTALLVLHDACTRDYSEVRKQAGSLAQTHLWLDARQRLGKVQFWRSYQTALLVAQRWRPARTLFLHDDVDFGADLLDEAEAIWQATSDDAARRVLYLFSSSKDEEQGRWIKFARRDLPEKGCRLTNWFDLQAFMVDLEFFELLGFRMVPIHSNRWKRKPSTSSGVGRQLTLRLRGRASVYQAWPPLVSHGAEPSIANPEARVATDLDNRDEYAVGRARRRVSPRGGRVT
jgi:hypothetical protein